MVDVVKHALAQIQGPPDDLIVLLQPTQPLRTPEHVKAAIRLLQDTGADSVVSVVELPLTHTPSMVLRLYNDLLSPYHSFSMCTTSPAFNEEMERRWAQDSWNARPTRRQDVQPVYRPDGTVYAFWRKTLDIHGTIYGRDVRPLIIPASESCELDTEADWAALDARIRDQMKQQAICTCDTPQPYTHPSGRVICQQVSCGGQIVEKTAPVARP